MSVIGCAKLLYYSLDTKGQGHERTKPQHGLTCSTPGTGQAKVMRTKRRIPSTAKRAKLLHHSRDNKGQGHERTNGTPALPDVQYLGTGQGQSIRKQKHPQHNLTYQIIPGTPRTKAKEDNKTRPRHGLTCSSPEDRAKVLGRNPSTA